MTIELGIAPIAWSNDDLPQLGGDTPLELCLAEAKLAGYAGVEKGGKFPMQAQILGPLLERYGLKLVSGWFSGRLRHGHIEDEKRRIARQLHLYQELGAPVMVYAETSGSIQAEIDIPVADRLRMTEDELKWYAEKLSVFALWLEAEGCPMAFHHHMGTVIESEVEIDLLMQNTGPEVGLLLDTGHLAYAGGDIEAVARRWGKRINHVHAKDIRPAVLDEAKAHRLSFLRSVLAGVFTVPGDGGIDFRAFMAVLREIGYAGWVVVEAEQDPAKANPLDMARIGIAELRRTAAAAGIEIAG